ncbi:unnamed protein product [Nezara viridula]|uniref:Uncharacterized protein n=1 Tax=Nezara viridula TaxID=85310 RepID=A0A9P0MUI7_NEZVI|nr:unnamed protein product [Nezara viridula]
MEGLKESINILKDEVAKFNISEHIEQLGSIHRAVYYGDIVKLEELLRRGEDGDDEDGTPFNYTAAHWAAVRCDADILDLLNDFGTNMSAVEGTDLRPLHVAALAGNSAALIWLLENTYDIESTDIYDQTPLHQAALNGCLQAVKILVEYGASMEATDEYGMTPVCLAAARGFSHIVHFLLQEGANPAVRDIDGKTLLHASSAVDDVATIVCLLKTGIYVNAKDNMNSTPLHDAAKNDCCKAIRLLLQSGADKIVRDIDGCTPFDRAKEAGHKKSITLLMDKEEGETVLLKDYVEETECNDMQIDSTTSFVEPDSNFSDIVTENSLLIDSTTTYVDLSDRQMENSDVHTTDKHNDAESNNVMDRENFTVSCNYNNACDYGDDKLNSICCDDSVDEEEPKLQLDFSALTPDDINKIIF